MATSVVIPATNPGSSPSDEEIIWRRTDSGWVRAEDWLVKRDYLYHQPSPPVYPLAALPMVVLLSVTALVLGQPATKRKKSIRPRRANH